MNKIYILDTTVILNDSNAIFSFPEEHVIIPLSVIEKVDKFKREMNDLGKNAREFNRTMDTLRKRGSLTEGIELDNKGTLQILFRATDYFSRIACPGLPGIVEGHQDQVEDVAVLHDPRRDRLGVPSAQVRRCMCTGSRGTSANRRDAAGWARRW